jgi:hypothetical protein
MKYTINALFCVVIACLFISCASDDSTATPQNEEVLETDVSHPDYFPVSPDNYWSYRTNTDGVESIDSLYVTSIHDNSFTLGLNAGLGGRGVMANMLSDGVLTKQGSALMLNSSLDFNLGLLHNDVIEFEGLVLHDVGRLNGDTLFSVSGSYDDDLHGNPLSVDYTLSSVRLGALDHLNFDGTLYTDVEVIDIILEISISIELEIAGVPAMFMLVAPQEIIKIQTYYSPEIGLVKSDTLHNYTLHQSTLNLLNSLNIHWLIAPSANTVSQEEMRAHFVKD